MSLYFSDDFIIIAEYPKEKTYNKITGTKYYVDYIVEKKYEISTYILSRKDIKKWEGMYCDEGDKLFEKPVKRYHIFCYHSGEIPREFIYRLCENSDVIPIVYYPNRRESSTLRKHIFYLFDFRVAEIFSKGWKQDDNANYSINPSILREEIKKKSYYCDDVEFVN